MKGLTGRQLPRLYEPSLTSARKTCTDMIDIFALALSHGLMFLGLWRMISRDDLDGEAPAKPDA